MLVRWTAAVVCFRFQEVTTKTTEMCTICRWSKRSWRVEADTAPRTPPPDVDPAWPHSISTGHFRTDRQGSVRTSPSPLPPPPICFLTRTGRQVLHDSVRNCWWYFSLICLINGPTLAFLVICDNKACISQKLMVHTRENVSLYH